MAMQKEFTIDKVSWHTEVEGNPESVANVKRRFQIIVEFLHTNGLTVREMLSAGEEPTDDFSIRSTDLTEEGLEVMKRGYDKWLKKVVNKKKNLNDVSILSKVLAEIRDG